MLYCYVPVEIFCLTLWEKPINTGNILCLELIESTLSNLCVCVFYVQDSYLKTISSSSHVYYYSLCDIHIVSVFMFTGKWNVPYGVFIRQEKSPEGSFILLFREVFLCYLRTNLYVCVNILLICVYVHIFDMFSYSVRGCLIKGVKYITFISIY